MWWPFSSGYPPCRPEDVDSQAYDYIIIGGGTAGCVLASRLSEDPDVSVLLLERGKANDHWLSRIPVLAQNPLPGTGFTWLPIEPMEYANKRQDIATLRAEVLGGNTRINGTVYQRGSAADYDHWAALGHPNWNYESVQPYFVKSERSLDQPKSEYRGTKGPWTNQKSKLDRIPLKWFEGFQNAALKLGFPHVEDANSPHAPCDGVASMDMTVDEHGERMATSRAFLPIDLVHRREGHLTICPEVLVTRIEFSGNRELKRAERVHFQCKGDQNSQRIFSARINREAILCSGALGSPQVLMLSGIGPQNHLEEIGIPVVHDLPGVGSHLQDHVGIPLMWEVPRTQSIGILALSVWTAILEFLKYVFFGTGLLSIAFLPVSLFVRASSIDENTAQLISQTPLDVTQALPSSNSRNNNNNNNAAAIAKLIPDIEIMAISSALAENTTTYIRRFPRIGIVSLYPTLLQPKSCGTVRLASADPSAPPKIDLGYFSERADYAVARKAVRLALACARTMSQQGFPIARAHSVPERPADDDCVDEYIRRTIRTVYHYSSTCRMAPAAAVAHDDLQQHQNQHPGVVDDELRVHGTRNLRVADASVFPNVLATHLQAPTVMVAERCADFIKAERAKERN